MTDNRKTTVPDASVGADAVQSSHKTSTNIITNSDKQINLQAAKKSNNFGLNTVSMTELYDTVYPPRKPIVNDLLYSGTYLFVGAPTELLERLPGVSIQANILTRKLNVSADRLYNDYGIRYESRRTHEGRVVKLTLENSGA